MGRSVEYYDSDLDGVVTRDLTDLLEEALSAQREEERTRALAEVVAGLVERGQFEVSDLWRVARNLPDIREVDPISSPPRPAVTPPAALTDEPEDLSGAAARGQERDARVRPAGAAADRRVAEATDLVAGNPVGGDEAVQEVAEHRVSSPAAARDEPAAPRGVVDLRGVPLEADWVIMHDPEEGGRVQVGPRIERKADSVQHALEDALAEFRSRGVADADSSPENPDYPRSLDVSRLPANTCPSSGDLRQAGRFRCGESGSSGGEVRRLARGAASAGCSGSGA